MQFVIIYKPFHALQCRVGLSDIGVVLMIYRDILKVSILQYFDINYCDTMPVYYCHLKILC